MKPMAFIHPLSILPKSLGLPALREQHVMNLKSNPCRLPVFSIHIIDDYDDNIRRTILENQVAIVEPRVLFGQPGPE